MARWAVRNGLVEDGHAVLSARPFACQTRHLLELANLIEAAALFAIAHDFEAVPGQRLDAVKLSRCRRIQVNHARVLTDWRRHGASG